LDGPHILVVGGTGMLSGLCEALAGDGGRLSLLARRATAWGGAAAGQFDCDYYDEAGFTAALDAAVAANGPVDLAVTWIHTLKIAASRRVAERTRGRLFQVLGSAAADPARPEVLDLGRTVVDGLRDCRLRQVVLGFKVEAGRSRWLIDEEISGGVLEAIRADRPVSVIGQTEPWSLRP
jgi:NAD(P)-dependent dehydrogenase (short-subunit alcohol dehydrogenase family)